MDTVSKNSQLGSVSIAMILISVVGVFAFNLIFLSAPVGIVCGIFAAKRGNKTLGVVGAVINTVLLIGLVTVWILAATSKGD